MKVRTSITLSEELLRAVDECARQQKKTRSGFIEAALWAFVRRHAQNDKWNARDLEIINRNADSLNQEASDVLEYSLQ
jgi:metal-responsive CopG/Arc/MetJ family transcriptional regulator